MTKQVLPIIRPVPPSRDSPGTKLTHRSVTAQSKIAHANHKKEAQHRRKHPPLVNKEEALWVSSPLLWSVYRTASQSRCSISLLRHAVATTNRRPLLNSKYTNLLSTPRSNHPLINTKRPKVQNSFNRSHRRATCLIRIAACSIVSRHKTKWWCRLNLNLVVLVLRAMCLITHRMRLTGTVAKKWARVVGVRLHPSREYRVMTGLDTHRLTQRAVLALKYRLDPPHQPNELSHLLTGHQAVVRKATVARREHPATRSLHLK